jgi:hypothetical protein
MFKNTGSVTELAQQKESPATGGANASSHQSGTLPKSQPRAAKMRREGTLPLLLQTQFDCCPFALAVLWIFGNE